ncbi:putative RNA methyltransferase At5g10620 [Miscanthus floridulus]|uniref:putative RNA methyltransferase At5g10620 n=1 Tax=Miscanthus floridulus TaxID=154761 RepID=UPI0034581A53
MGVGVFPWRCICGPEQSFSKSRSASASAPSPLGKRSKYSGQSVKAMPMRLLTVGKKRSRGTQLLVEEYKEKLGYYCDFEDTLIRSNPKLTSDVKVQVEAEDAAMMQQLKSDDFVVVLDENGKDVISEQIADLIGDAGNTGSSRLTFCIGGPYGLGVQVRERADATIRLSSLVLNHQVALIVLMEQLYRAWTIIKGQKYHH